MSNTEKVVYDKEKESDGQMILRISRKFVLLFAIIFLFDSLLDILSGFIDIVMDLLHLIMELFEYSFELLLEHILNANHHESEVILVNVALVFFIYALYRFCLLLPRICNALINKMNKACSQRKQQEAECWHHLAFSRKIKVSLTYLVWISLLLFIVTL